MLQIEYIPINELIPYKRNPRKNDAAVDAVAESIKAFGFRNPIIVDGDGVVIAGHTRLKAAKKLGLKTVPVICADDLTPEQAKAFRLVDNKTAELAEWDIELLDIELADIDMDMLPWFDMGEQSEPQEAVEDDYEPELPDEPKAKRGDIYKLGRHRLMCGDSTSVDDVQMLMGGGTGGLTAYRPTV